MEIIEQIGAYAGLAAIIGLALLSALYFSQARDVRRLREWAGRAPERTSEPAAQAQRLPPRAVPRAPGAQGLPPGTVRPAPTASATGAAPAQVAAATPAAARAAEVAETTKGVAGEEGPEPDAVSQDTMAHPPPTAPDEFDDEDEPGDEGLEGDESERERLEREQREDDEFELERLERERLGDDEFERGPLEGEQREDDEFELDRLERERLGDDEFERGPLEGEQREDDYEDEGYVETDDRPAVPAPAPVAAATSAARRPTIPGPPTAPARPSPAPITSGGSILPPYERSRPGADPWHRRIFSSPGRVALAIAAGVVVLAAATLGGLQLAGEDEAPDSPGAPQATGETPAGAGEGEAGQQPAPQASVDPGSVTVAVLNATTVQGAANNLGDTVESEGYQVGTVSNFTDDTRAESVVLYAAGAEREADSVSRRLDIPQKEQIDPESQGLAGDASVVILVGADKAQ